MMIKKLLVRKRKKAYIEEQSRDVVISEEKVYFIEDLNKDYHCSDGVFSRSDLSKSDTIIKSNKGKEFMILDASFIDSFKGIRKTAQTMPLKDLGFILSELAISKNDVILDAGAGSGACACLLARYAKKVYSYDIEEKNLEQARKNASYFNIKNIIFRKQDIYDKAKDNCDIAVLDVPEPWSALNALKTVLRPGGFLVVYCPQIIQSQRIVNDAADYMHLKTVEVIEREWKIDGNIVKPKSLSNIHSGFISIFRKII